MDSFNQLSLPMKYAVVSYVGQGAIMYYDMYGRERVMISQNGDEPPVVTKLPPRTSYPNPIEILQFVLAPITFPISASILIRMQLNKKS